MWTKRLARSLKVCGLYSNLSRPTHHRSDWDLVFKDDERESNPASFKLLQMAHAWKKAQNKKPTEIIATEQPADEEMDQDSASDVASSH